jgi:hypothetical protein
MKNIIEFLDKWSIKIILPLTIIIFLKTCGTNNKIEKLEKQITNEIYKTDSLVKTETISKEEFEKIIKLEGLRTEKRMIQSTDRKILDVNRQSEIDREIESLK